MRALIHRTLSHSVWGAHSQQDLISIRTMGKVGELLGGYSDQFSLNVILI